MKKTSWRWTTCRCSSQSCVRWVCVYHGVYKFTWLWCWWAVWCPQEELQKRIVEEQQNNNLSMEILNGNAECVTGLVGNAQALKEPGTDLWPFHAAGPWSQGGGAALQWGLLSFPDTAGAQNMWRFVPMSLISSRPALSLVAWLIAWLSVLFFYFLRGNSEPHG